MLEADGQAAPLPLPTSAFIVQSSWRPPPIYHQPGHTQGLLFCSHSLSCFVSTLRFQSKSLISNLGESIVCNGSIDKVNGRWKAVSRVVIILWCRSSTSRHMWVPSSRLPWLHYHSCSRGYILFPAKQPSSPGNITVNSEKTESPLIMLCEVGSILENRSPSPQAGFVRVTILDTFQTHT